MEENIFENEEGMVLEGQGIGQITLVDIEIINNERRGIQEDGEPGAGIIYDWEVRGRAWN